MKRLFRKLFKPKYEPAGIIHYGQFEITMNGTLYEGIQQPSGIYDLLADREYVGSYPKHRITQIIIDHAKEQKNDR